MWERFESVCHRLESIAHKQLRGVALSESDEAFIRGYGERIAHLMFYNSNSFHDPRDDTPRIVDVFSNAEMGTHMEVGVSRAHQIYVLYPWKDDYLLCEGAVLPYYEFPSESRLNDDEWKALLDSAERPDIPGWFKPIVAGGKLDSSRLGER